MASKDRPLPVWIRVNAWREIFARMFEEIETQLNLSPKWLVNPATNRRLKLDMFYPEIGVAVRFEGLQGKQRRQRLSLEEEDQLHVRHNARIERCRAHDVFLIVVKVTVDSPKTIFQHIDFTLSRAGRQGEDKARFQKISQARAVASNLSHRVKNSGNLKLYANLWEDRQYQVPEAATSPTSSHNEISFTVGMEVEHIIFGPGLIVAVTPSDNDIFLKVDFVTAGQKTLAAGLVVGKLKPR